MILQRVQKQSREGEVQKRDLLLHPRVVRVLLGAPPRARRVFAGGGERSCRQWQGDGEQDPAEQRQRFQQSGLIAA